MMVDTTSLDRLLNLAFGRPKAISWELQVHRCPMCNKAVTSFNEFQFVTENGECLTCDHVREDL